MEPAELAKRVRTILEDKKGRDIRVLDVRGRSPVTDCIVVVSGQTAPHLKAMFGEVQHVLKGEGVPCYRKSGVPESGWLVLDYVDVIIHIFAEDTRRYYGIEELWEEAPPLP